LRRDKPYGVADGEGEAEASDELESEDFFFAVDFALVAAGDAFGLAPESFIFASFFAVVDAAVLEVVVVEVSAPLFWQEARNATPMRQTIEVRTDFFIGCG
jgi:hypothetical protein